MIWIRSQSNGGAAVAVKSSCAQIDGKDRYDLVVHFEIHDLQILSTHTQALFTGKTFDGTVVEGKYSSDPSIVLRNKAF